MIDIKELVMGMKEALLKESDRLGIYNSFERRPEVTPYKAHSIKQDGYIAVLELQLTEAQQKLDAAVEALDLIFPMAQVHASNHARRNNLRTYDESYAVVLNKAKAVLANINKE